MTTILPEGSEFWLREREDRIGDEVTKRRPWVVTSREDVHSRQIFISANEGTAPQRPASKMDLCVKCAVSDSDYTSTREPDPKAPKRVPFVVDCQQIWTFLEDRLEDDAVKYKGLLLPSKLEDVRDMIGKHLEYAPASRGGWLYQGRVIWVRLAPLHADQGIRVPSGHSDITSWREAVERLLGYDPKNPSDWFLPAIVLTHDRYLPEKQEGLRPPGVYRVLTAIPLILSEKLLRKGAPRVPHPKVRAVAYAPLTQFLMTVSYDACTHDRGRRVITSRPGFEGWEADRATLQRILTEVRGFMNIQVPS